MSDPYDITKSFFLRLQDLLVKRSHKNWDSCKFWGKPVNEIFSQDINSHTVDDIESEILKWRSAFHMNEYGANEHFQEFDDAIVALCSDAIVNLQFCTLSASIRKLSNDLVGNNTRLDILEKTVHTVRETEQNIVKKLNDIDLKLNLISTFIEKIQEDQKYKILTFE